MAGTPPAAGRRVVRAGCSKAAVAHQLGVSGQTGAAGMPAGALAVRPGMRTACQGKPARLGPAELARVRRVLDRGPVAAGFDSTRWTLERVAEVIEGSPGGAPSRARAAAAAPAAPRCPAALEPVPLPAPRPADGRSGSWAGPGPPSTPRSAGAAPECATGGRSSHRSARRRAGPSRRTGRWPTGGGSSAKRAVR
jgi:hypothetical protein